MIIKCKYAAVLTLTVFLLMSTGCTFNKTRKDRNGEPYTTRTQVVKLPWVKPQPDYVTGLDLSLFGYQWDEQPATETPDPQDSSPYTDADGLSLSILGDHVNTHKGIQLELIERKTDHIKGLSLSGLTSNFTTLRGIEVCGIMSKSRAGYDSDSRQITKEKGGKGVQIAGLFNIILGPFDGFQISALANACNELKGCQINAISNQSVELNGAQLCTLINSSAYVRGVQISPTFNLSKDDMDGVQVVGLYNHTKTRSSGLQVGLINKAHYLHKGLQIGLLNFSHNGILPVCPLINYGYANEQFLYETARHTPSTIVCLSTIRFIDNQDHLEQIVMESAGFSSSTRYHEFYEAKEAIEQITNQQALINIVKKHHWSDIQSLAFLSINDEHLQQLAGDNTHPDLALAASIKLGKKSWENAFQTREPSTIVSALPLFEKTSRYLGLKTDDPHPDWFPDETTLLWKYGNKELAEAFLNSYNDSLINAGKDWVGANIDQYHLHHKDGKYTITEIENKKND